MTLLMFQYIINEEKTWDDIEWKKYWLSEVFIKSASGKTQEINEYLAYEIDDLMGDFGGYLGKLIKIFNFQTLQIAIISLSSKPID